ncbi:hypothetical protein [Oceanobacillus massiliensis]|uniref:hypothetical protein n=1 Tax=Oceanobacillus massiliensis TaxID=1465765 RepID=UPI0002E51B25|nr:hypothetical protein [Oceanobacillus massiliensis]
MENQKSFEEKVAKIEEDLVQILSNTIVSNYRLEKMDKKLDEMNQLVTETRAIARGEV